MRKIVLALLVAASFCTPTDAAEITGRASVVDGDTIEINGVRIRFDGVDAPESRQTCDNALGKPYRCGASSAKALDEFLAKSRPTTCIPTGKSYGRIVGHCRRSDGQDVNTWLVRNGHALDWPKYSRGRYAGEQSYARSNSMGIWSGSFQMPCEVRGANCN